LRPDGPAHKGVEGNEKADEWAKVAAEEPDTRGGGGMAELFGLDGGTPSAALTAPCKPQAGDFGEKKWVEARRWAGGRASRKKYKMPESRKPEGTIAESTKRLASRYYQLKTGHARIGQYLHWAKIRPTAQCWWCQCPRTRESTSSRCVRNGRCSRRFCGGRCGRRPGGGRAGGRSGI